MTDREWFPERPPVIQLDRYEPAKRPERAMTRWARRVRPIAAVLVGALVLVGCAWKLSDAVWQKADPAPVVLPNTVPSSTPVARTPAPYPFGRAQVREKAPVPVKQRSALCATVTP
jgi:hypothetical protein